VVGRGAASILARAPHCFHVFVYASLWRKVRWFEEQFPEHAKEAEQELAATDLRRAAYVRHFYDQEWTDRRLYHLMINSCMGFEAMVKATIDGAGLSVAARAAS
jgi:cytidylate kinase